MNFICTLVNVKARDIITEFITDTIIETDFTVAIVTTIRIDTFLTLAF